MLNLLRQLRFALELEQACAGSFLPLGDPARAPKSPAAPGSDSRRPPLPEASRPPSPGRSATSRHARPAIVSEALSDQPVVMANQDLFGNKLDPSQDSSRPPHERIEALLPEDSPLRGMQTLEEVEDYAQRTVLAPIDEARDQVVFGTGDPHAGLVIIGEAPGAEEDRHGEPFVGRAGLLLNKILEAIHFRREEVYITNILKSRPPNNRDPLAEEVEAHLPLLYKQIALIRPRLLLCVGKTAGNALLGRRSSLGALRDKFHDFYGIPLMVTYHPAALLRNPQWKRPTWEDVKLLRTRYDALAEG